VTKKVDFIMLAIILSLLTISLISGCGGGDSNITGISSSQLDKSVITGTVYDENGISVREIPVFLKSVRDYEAVIKNTVTGTEGTFSFIITSEGSYYLEAKNEESVYYSYEFQVKLGVNQNVPVGYTPGPAGPTGPPGLPGVTGDTGATGATGNVIMGSIRINAQDNRGDAVTNAEIILKRDAFSGSDSSLSASDAAGTGWYLFENLEYGNYVAEINASVYPPQHYSILLNTSNVTGNLLVGWGNNYRVDDAPGAVISNIVDIDVDPSGNAYAIWEDRRSGNRDIYFSYRSFGGSWTASVRVDNAPGAIESQFPKIAVDGSGNAYAIWYDDRNGNNDIYSSYRPAGGSWQPDVRVDDDSIGMPVYYPDIAVDSSGNAYAVWQDDRTGFWHIYFSYCPHGGSWQANVMVDDGSSILNEEPSITVDSSGNAYAVWEYAVGGSNNDIYFSYRPFGGAWGPGLRVDDDPGTANAEYPAIAVDLAGNAYAIWLDSRSGNRDVYSAFYPSGGYWQANTRVDDASGSTDVHYPDIVAEKNGDVHAVWQDERNGNRDIYYSYRPYGYFWGLNARVDTDTGSSNAWQPSLAVDEAGNLYALWEDLRGGATISDVYFAELIR